ncbi:MAG: DUF805 domain-containing protein [Pseudomonadota bacterium]
MTFRDAIKACFGNYATFTGRAARPEYWWFVLFVILGVVAAGFVDAVLFGDMQVGPAAGLFQLVTLLPFLAVGWRRMQDTGRPGWMIFLPMIVSVAFIFLSVMGFANGPAPNFNGSSGGARFAILGALQFVASVLILWWLTRPSDPSANAYGPNPAEVQ